MTPLPSASALFAACLYAGAASAVSWTVQAKSANGEVLADAAIAVELRSQPSRAPVGTKADMAQRERQFQPFVLVVQTGTAVNFPNFDTVRHHVYSFSPVKTFDLKLYSGTPAEPVLFEKPGVAALGCNIHDKMAAHIVVVDTPLFTKTDAHGIARLELPPGEHTLKAWHPRMSKPLLQSQRITVTATAGQTNLVLE
jgi:plastocyanin